MSSYIEAKAKVIKLLDNNRMLIEIDRESHCSYCNDKKGCLVLNENKNNRFVLEYIEGIKEEDNILVSIKEKSMLKSAFLVYLLPLLIMLLTGIALNQYLKNDMLLALIFIAILVIYFTSLKFILKNSSDNINIRKI